MLPALTFHGVPSGPPTMHRHCTALHCTAPHYSTHVTLCSEQSDHVHLLFFPPALRIVQPTCTSDPLRPRFFQGYLPTLTAGQVPIGTYLEVYTGSGLPTKSALTCNAMCREKYRACPTVPPIIHNPRSTVHTLVYICNQHVRVSSRDNIR